MYLTKVEYNGLTFGCSECAYQAAKCANEEDRILFIGINGYEAKKVGQKVKLRSDWYEIQLGVMEEILRIKFSKPNLRESLIKTGDQFIAEANTWNDTFWGIVNGYGKNHLGTILMKIREDIK